MYENAYMKRFDYFHEDLVTNHNSFFILIKN